MSSCKVSMAQVLTPSEWCPPGTWWTYKSQTTQFFRDKIHEIFIYKKDTFVNNRNVKKIETYAAESDMWLSTIDPSDAFDSFTSPLRYNGYLLMYIQNDSIFANLSNFNSYPTFRYKINIGKDEYSFLYKFNSKIGDKFSYRRNLVDTAICSKGDTTKNDTFPSFWVLDTITKVDEEDYSYRLYGQDYRIRITQNKASNNYLYGYKYIYEYLAPLDYLYNIPLYDSFKKVFYSDSAYTFSCRYNRNYYFTTNYTSLYCYNQGGQGLFIDNHLGGKGKSGCKYVENFIKDKLAIKNIARDAIYLYPNPTKDKISIEGLESGYKIFVYSPASQLVLSFIVKNVKESIFLENLINGTYLLNIYNHNSELIKTTKIIKND